jgi:calcineurin-like phosphoesterase family protein
MIYFTADTHFCHHGIISSCNRPFETVDEMNKVLIQNWNSYVTNYDEIYILGDFAHKDSGREVNTILSKLKGKKYLIKGNHEKYLSDPEFKTQAFEWIKDYYVLTHEGIKIILFHYPLLEWDGFHHGSIHLYGHVHNSGSRYDESRKRFQVLGPRAMNVGVDVNDFYPVNIKQIMERAKQHQPPG